VTGSPRLSTKIIVAGGFGAGKTSFIGAISEVAPVRTEAAMTAASSAVDDLSNTPDKTSTTVAMDFGRITLDSDLALYLFGTPGQSRFQFMWDDLVRGALGAVVLVDTRRLEDCFPAIDYFERIQRLPFVIAENVFPGAYTYPEATLRDALDVEPSTPIVRCDARDREAVRQVLIRLVTHTMGRVVPQSRARGMAVNP
jgi:uncharacterized protein